LLRVRSGGNGHEIRCSRAGAHEFGGWLCPTLCVVVPECVAGLVHVEVGVREGWLYVGQLWSVQVAVA
jgi:hypothetical protein